MNGSNTRRLAPVFGFVVATILLFVSSGVVRAGTRYPRRATPEAAAAPAVASAPAVTLEKGYPQVCEGLQDLGIPAEAIEAALEDPTTVPGWNQPANPNTPPSWMNPRRRMLTVTDPGKPFHPLYNGLAFKAGCMHR